MTASDTAQTEESSEQSVEVPQPGDLYATPETYLFSVEVSAEWEVPLHAVDGSAFEALKNAGIRKRTVVVRDPEFVIAAESGQEETIRAALLETLSEAVDGVFGFPREGIDESMAIQDIDDIECEHGCGRRASIRNAPMQVNNRLYWGHVCRRCYIPPWELKDGFRFGSGEWRHLIQRSLDRLC